MPIKKNSTLCVINVNVRVNIEFMSNNFKQYTIYHPMLRAIALGRTEADRLHNRESAVCTASDFYFGFIVHRALLWRT